MVCGAIRRYESRNEAMDLTGVGFETNAEVYAEVSSDVQAIVLERRMAGGADRPAGYTAVRHQVMRLFLRPKGSSRRQGTDIIRPVSIWAECRRSL